MAYKLHKDCLEFFNKLMNTNSITGLQTQFDCYYLCLMAGLKYKKMGSTDMLKQDPFAKEIIEAYKGHKYKIIALLIATEIERLENNDVQVEVEKLICEIVNYDNKDGISDKGIELLNLYSAGGYEKIASSIEDNYFFECFFKEYIELLK